MKMLGKNPRGKMLWFNEDKGHGYIETEEGERLLLAPAADRRGKRHVVERQQLRRRARTADQSRDASREQPEKVAAPQAAVTRPTHAAAVLPGAAAR